MDGDGDEDLFMFDRDGSRILVFERENSEWIERPNWSQGWPEMRHWALLRDFDCDGLPDLFTGFQNNIHVWKNTGLNPDGAPSFESYATPLTASWDFGTGPQELPVICPFDDKPAIWDVDEDGDLDFISFTETSTRLYRFSGQAACGLDLTCTNRCYAMVSEGSEDNTLFIGEDHECNFNVVDPEGRPSDTEEAALRVHAGGAITALQLDGEHGHDLLVADVSTPPPVDFSLRMRWTVKTVRRGLTTPFRHSSAMKGPQIPLNCSDFLPLIHWIQMRMATGTSSSLPTLGMKLTMTDAFNCGQTMEPLRRLFGP